MQNNSKKDSGKKRVGVLRGGSGEHYKSSLKKGGDIILHIHENLSEKYKVVDILVDKDGLWHMNGVPVKLGDLTHKVDVVWNTSHPSFSNILESLFIPSIGVNPFFSAVRTSKDMLRKYMKKIKVDMPRHMLFSAYQKDFDPRYAGGSGEASGPRERYAIKKAKEVFEKFSSPWIVKSFTLDFDMSVYLAKTFNELVAAIEDEARHEKSILVEEFILGKAVSAHSVSKFRGQDVYVFPIVDDFGDSCALSFLEKRNLANFAKNLHKHLDARHYLKSDFILNSKGKIYLTNVELAPDLNQDSHFSKACESAGAKMHHVTEHMLETVF